MQIAQTEDFQEIEQTEKYNESKWEYVLRSEQLPLCVCMCAQLLKSCPTLCNPVELVRLLCPWDSPGKNTEMGCGFSW